MPVETETSEPQWESERRCKSRNVSRVLQDPALQLLVCILAFVTFLVAVGRFSNQSNKRKRKQSCPLEQCQPWLRKEVKATGWKKRIRALGPTGTESQETEVVLRIKSKHGRPL